MKTYNIVFDNIENLVKFIFNKQINTYDNVLVQIFSGILDKDLLQQISSTILEEVPSAKIIGTTTDGEILNDKVLTHTITISFTIFKNTYLILDYIDITDIKDSFLIGQKLAKKLIQPTSKVFILFGDGLNLNGEDFLNGVYTVSNDVIVAGGLAGDNANFNETFLICKDKIVENGAVGVSLNSTILKVTTNYSFAWQEIGRSFLVEKAKKNVVYQIDGMTPYRLYEKYLGDEIAKQLPKIGIEFPLIIHNQDMNIARAVIGKNDDGSLVFAGNINEGDYVKFGVGNPNIILQDSINMLSTIDNIPIESIFIYSCMARRRFLESQASIDIQYFSQIADVSGFFTYGEFYTNKKQLNFLNETLTLLGLSESNHISQNIINKTDIHFQNITTLQAISNLANAASKEFEELNNNLELKIKKEVEKNIEFEKRLFNSMKMASLGDMIANIAHQWRQPLSVITSTASAMQLNKDLDLLDDDSFKQHIDSIISQAMYLSETVDTFRNFVKEKHELKTFPIQKEIQKALKITEVTFKDNKIELIDNIDYENEISVKLIVGELSQVLINIINNAKDVLIQNNIQDKWIKLDLELNKTDVVIFIEDNGGGIPDEIIDKIFEPYFTTKDDNIGTGIGLYMSYDIIVKHFKGDIKVVNTNHGAKFIIKIPLCYE